MSAGGVAIGLAVAGCGGGTAIGSDTPCDKFIRMDQPDQTRVIRKFLEQTDNPLDSWTIERAYHGVLYYCGNDPDGTVRSSWKGNGPVRRYR